MAPLVFLRIGRWSESICVNPCLSPFLICAKILIAGQSLTFGLAKEFNADKKRDKKGFTQMGQCGPDCTGSLPTQCRLSFVSRQALRSTPTKVKPSIVLAFDHGEAAASDDQVDPSRNCRYPKRISGSHPTSMRKTLSTHHQHHAHHRVRHRRPVLARALSSARALARASPCHG